VPRGLIESRWAFRSLIALPAIAMLSRYAFLDEGLGRLLQSSGEWAVRLLILTLMVTPLRLLLKQLGSGPYWPMWLFRRRRDLGLAAFLYSALHLGTYMSRANIHVALYDLPYKEYLAGWIAFAIMLLLSLTSADAAVHAMGLWWKVLQRLAYVSALAAALHWFWIRLDHAAVYFHFAPLVLLEAYRLWYNFARPAGVRH
jgi:methionine sulfoxide reductase heme-binding subunit